MKGKIKETLKTLKNKPIQKAAIMLLLIYVSGVFSQGITYIINLPKILNGIMSSTEIFSLSPLACAAKVFTSVSGIASLIIISCVMVMVWNYLIKTRIKKKTGIKDERGFSYANGGTYGTSALLENENVKEIEKILDWKEIGDQEGDILGEVEGKLISLPSEKEFTEKKEKNNWTTEELINNKLNNHKAVCGASGTMKTRAFAKNAILQMAKRGESGIITDPKGELYSDCANYLESKGYDVKVFNLVNSESSDSWNCLSTIGNSSTYAKIFADTIVQNANENGDQYWCDNAANILKAVCLYVIESPNETEKNMGRVYDIISQKTTEEIDNIFSCLSEKSVAKRSYNIFRRCNEIVKGQILNGLGIMLSVFQDDVIRNITSENEIDLEKPAFEKTAYFLITSDQHKTFDFLAILFYAMSFIKLVEKIDSETGKREAGKESKTTLPINLIMDEMPNIGQIPDFVKKISAVRSRKINITVIFQNIAQLMNRYPNNQWQEILGNCDTTIFLGCTDPLTAEYISKKTGIATVEVESVNTGYDRKIAIFSQDTEYREVKSSGQRKVMMDDEVLRIKNTDELVFLRGQQPIKCKKFDYTRHPDAKELTKRSIADYIPLWREKQISEAKEKEEEKKRVLQASQERTKKREEEREKEEKQSLLTKKPKTKIEPTEIESKDKNKTETVRSEKANCDAEDLMQSYFTPTPAVKTEEKNNEWEDIDYELLNFDE